MKKVVSILFTVLLVSFAFSQVEIEFWHGMGL